MGILKDTLEIKEILKKYKDVTLVFNYTSAEHYAQYMNIQEEIFNNINSPNITFLKDEGLGGGLIINGVKLIFKTEE